MHRFRELSLRTQLLLLAILLVLPSLGIIIFDGYIQRKDDLQHAAVETQKLADTIAAEQEHLTNEAQRLGKLLTQLPEVKRRDPSKVQSILAAILKDNPRYLNIAITDRSGSVWAAAIPFDKPFSLADRRFFKNAIASKRFASGECVIGKIKGIPTFAMGYPLINERGEFDGVIGLGFDLDQLKPLLERSQLPTDTNYVIVDHNGIIVSRGHDSVGLVGTAIKPDAFKSMEARPDKATYEFVRKDGDRRILTHRKLWLSGEQKPYLYVLAGISYKTTVAKAYREILYNSSLLVPFVIIAFALVFYIGKRSISDRVAVLDSAARQLAMGNLQGKIADLVKGGELGSLGETFDDVAQQLKAREQALQNSESHYRAMIDAFDGFIYICSSDYRIEFMNESLKRRTGHDATGEFCYKALHDLDSVCSWCVNGRVFAGENVQWEVLSPKDERWHQVSNTPIHNADGSISKQAMIIDITDRKLIVQALVDSNTLLQQTLASLNEAVFIVQTGTRVIQDVNITVERMFGYTRDELIGSTTSCLHINEEMSQQFGSEMLKAYAEKGLFETTFKMRRKDGSVFDSEHCVTPIRGENGAIVRHVCVVRDISERKRAEQALIEKTQMLADINENLEHMVNKSVSELRQKDEMLILQSRFSAMGEMLNNIAHQWRQPLNNIGLITQNLRLYFESAAMIPPQLDDDINTTMKILQHMSNTIDDSRNFFRKDKVQSEFRVAQALSTILGILDATLKKNGIRIEINADDTVSTSGYLNEYGQAMLNIIINAKDVLMERQVAGPVISIRVFSENNKAVVTIRDNGGGIKDEVLPRIFDPYFSTKEPGKGTGIGLYMSKAIIEKNMNGRLTVDNVDGGAEFRIEV